MTKSRYILIVFLVNLLLPIAAIAPYAFYGKIFRALVVVWQNGFLLFFLNLNFALISALVCSVLLIRFHPLGRLFYSASSMIITCLSALFAMMEHRHSLLVVVFAFAVTLVWVGEWLRKILDLPYYNSKRRWWESHPKSIPGITARVYEGEGSEKVLPARVVNFGETGCFVFLTDAEWTFAPRFIELTFNNRQKLVSQVVPVLFTSDNRGVGLRFEKISRQDDWHHELQEYLNQLRRLGYVSG